METLRLDIKAGNKEGIAVLDQFAKSSDRANASLSKLSKGSQQANFALMNLGRVAQDAPFGFIGIQNNLNPLLESFQRLRQELGSNTAAMKALGRSLMGAGGIGFALSAASALFLVFGDSMFQASASAQAAAKSQADFADAMAKSTGDAAAETAQMTALAKVINDTTQSTDTRKRALDELKKSYQGNIDLQKLDINDGAQLTKIIDGISQALLRKARANAFANLIAEEEAKVARLQNQSTQELADKVGFMSKAWSVLKNSVTNGSAALGAANAGVEVAKNAFGEVSKEIGAANKNIETYTGLLNATTLAQIQNNDTKTLSNTKLKEEVEAYSKLNEYLKFYNQFYKNRTNPEIGGEISTPFAGPQAAPDQTGQEAGRNRLAMLLDNEIALKKNNDQLKLYAEYAQQANDITAASAQIFTDLGAALLQGQSLGEALGNVFKKLAADIAAAAIKALIFKTILSAITGGSSTAMEGAIKGFTGGGTGFGDIFGKFFGKGFAKGGVSTGPQSGHLELLHGTEAIIPMNKMAAFADQAAKMGFGGDYRGSQEIILSPEVRWSGPDMLIGIRRAESATNFVRGNG